MSAISKRSNRVARIGGGTTTTVMSSRSEEVSLADVSTNKELLKKYNESFTLQQQQQGSKRGGADKSIDVLDEEMSMRASRVVIAAAP